MIQVDSPILKIIVSRIVEAVQPDKIILFGSRARGDAQKRSDFDIMVIKRDVSQLSFPRVLKSMDSLKDVKEWLRRANGNPARA